MATWWDCVWKAYMLHGKAGSLRDSEVRLANLWDNFLCENSRGPYGGGGVGGTSDDLTTFHLAPPLKGPPSLRGPGT